MATIAELSTPPAAAPPRKVSRWAGLDLARLVAAMAIIWIHVPRSAALAPTTIWARFAVPFFTCVAVFFILDKAGPDRLGSFWQYAAARVRRIYLPFLAWSAVYLVFKGVKKIVMPEQDNDFHGWEMLWWGSAYHLWFLPFILAVSLAMFPLAAWTQGQLARRHVLGAAGLVAGLVVALVNCPPNWLGNENGHCIWEALPAVGWGIALAAFLPRSADKAKATSIVGIAVFAAATIALGCVGRNCLAENAAGLGFAMVALCWSPRGWLARASGVGAFAYGIYCSHLLFIKIAEAAATKLRWPISPALDVAIFIVAAAASVSCAWLLSRSQWMRWLAA